LILHPDAGTKDDRSGSTLHGKHRTALSTELGTLAQPGLASMPGALLAVIPLALSIFRRHHQDWLTSANPLLACMLFAAYAGVSQRWAWFRA
jgi:hypothetical protein